MTATVALELKFSFIYKYEHKEHEEFSFDYTNISDGECQPIHKADEKGKTSIAMYACNCKGKIEFYKVPKEAKT